MSHATRVQGGRYLERVAQGARVLGEYVRRAARERVQQAHAVVRAGAVGRAGQQAPDDKLHNGRARGGPVDKERGEEGAA